MNNKVIVIGCYVGGLAVVRSFANKPVDVIALSYEYADIAHRSKYVNEWYKIPHPRLQAEEFINFLISKAPEWKGAIIFDTDDHIAVTISKNKGELSKYYKIVSANWDLMRKFIVKEEAHKLAHECGVKHPHSYLPKTTNEFQKIKNELHYPCILKPIKGHEFFAKFGKKIFEIANDEDYDKYVEQCLTENIEVMVQEIIPGPDTNIYKCMTYINSKNEIPGMFFYRKIRQNPPGFGVPRVIISTEKNEEVELLFNKLIQHSGYKGFCTAEFKKDERDGKLKFIEINVRMPRSFSHPLACGINFPWIIYNDLVLKSQLTFDGYKENLYWIEFYSDLFNTILRNSKENFTLKEYLTPYFNSKKTFAVFDLKDIVPFLIQSAKLPRVFLK